ncbi:hypothetical protein LMG27177_07332 [Paraburkholderia fynbosensis]|uniref:Uncharacterized protein n=1 Tax=Paraburkholderia fynbosensis TaxID=1200993 RepID=A0A6J5H527_9BURK|nr:hypothetical protein LMG27177_07332 [Paraburkholderia fynbosensis]
MKHASKLARRDRFASSGAHHHAPTAWCCPGIVGTRVAPTSKQGAEAHRATSAALRVREGRTAGPITWMMGKVVRMTSTSESCQRESSVGTLTFGSPPGPYCPSLRSLRIAIHSCDDCPATFASVSHRATNRGLHFFRAAKPPPVQRMRRRCRGARALARRSQNVSFLRQTCATRGRPPSRGLAARPLPAGSP